MTPFDCPLGAFGVETVSAGAVVTLSVTVTFCGECNAPDAETTIVPEWEPAASPAVLTEQLILMVPVPLPWLTVSHEGLAVAIQFSVPPPTLEIVIVWGAGLLPPCVAAYVRLKGVTSKTEGSGGI